MSSNFYKLKQDLQVKSTPAEMNPEIADDFDYPLTDINCIRQILTPSFTYSMSYECLHVLH